MIALDTNVLVRFLVEDDPQQCAAAARVVDDAVAAGEPIYLSDLVLAELVWVLERAYGFSREDISATLRRLFSAAAAVFDSSARVARAIERYDAGKAGFADYLLVQHALAAGAAAFYTFDKRLHAEELAVEPPL